MTCNQNLEAVRRWLRTCPHLSDLQQLPVDDLAAAPNCAGLYPAGVKVVRSDRDILGGRTVVKEHSFTLALSLMKAPGDDVGAERNAGRVLDVAAWVEEQSRQMQAPRLDGAELASARAEGGKLESAGEDGIGGYGLTLTVTTEKYV